MGISIDRQLVPACSPQKRHSVFSFISNMIAIRRQRSQLLQLDAHLLDDIGLSRAEALAESKETLWNVPDHWRK